MNPRERALEIHRRLLEKYGEPSWRDSLPILDELISTILSQNTNDINRDRAFTRLKQRFETWENVRDADANAVIEAIRSAGLANQKGPRIQKILHQITAERGSLELEFLRELSADEAMDWLMQFKGVGPKTASIVLLFSLGKSAFPVDTHIQRVTGRMGLRPKEMKSLVRYHFDREVSQRNFQTLTLFAVSSFGESLRWVPHHPSGGSHLSTNFLKIQYNRKLQ